MSTETRERTCEDRIGAHMEGRLSAFRMLNAIAAASDADDLIEALVEFDEAEDLISSSMWEQELRHALALRDHADSEEIFTLHYDGETCEWFVLAGDVELYRSEDYDDACKVSTTTYIEAECEIPDRAVDDAREWAYERISDYPLGASQKVIHKIDLSTGGPGDWLEIECDPDEGPDSQHYIETITYHFHDWFDHAERRLTGADEDTAAEFARQVMGWGM